MKKYCVDVTEAVSTEYVIEAKNNAIEKVFKTIQIPYGSKLICTVAGQPRNVEN